MAKSIPTDSEIKEFQDKQGKLYDDMEGYKAEQEKAFDKNNPQMYEEAQRKIDASQAEFDKNTEEWDKKYGNEIEQETEMDNNQDVQQSNDVDQESSKDEDNEM